MFLIKFSREGGIWKPKLGEIAKDQELDLFVSEEKIREPPP